MYPQFQGWLRGALWALGIALGACGLFVIQRWRSESRLRAANQELERRVAARTEDLAKAQEALHAALLTERELSDMRANFVSLISHEFRTPLGVIMSAADLLRMFGNSLTAEKQEHHLSMLHQSTRTLANLIDEVLLIRRVEEGQQKFDPVPVDLVPLCQAICRDAEASRAGDCPVVSSFEGPFDGAHSDESLIRHILVNLLTNAIKYSEPGESVALRVMRDGDHAVFEIADTGIGIPLDDQPHLFRPFIRGSNVGARHGTGLGLTIVKACADLHGGTVSFESNPGKGTCFTVRLPMFEPINESQPIS
jgi:signal transduction histidine kinase